MRCPNCHSKLSEKSMMCVHCGKIFRLIDGELIEVEQKEASQPLPPLDFTTLDMNGSYLKAKDIPLDDLMKYFEQSKREQKFIETLVCQHSFSDLYGIGIRMSLLWDYWILFY